MSATPLTVNRPPYPLPYNVKVPIYFTAQPGGAVISGANGEWLGAQVVYPNYRNDLPKARGLFWRYEPDGVGWSPYGTGTVAADGRQVVPDQGVRIYSLSGAMFDGHTVPPPYRPIVQWLRQLFSSRDGDPVDLATGLFVQLQTDLSVGGTLPLDLTRAYRPGDYNSRAFGVGTSFTYSLTLVSTNLYQTVDLMLPDGALVQYTRIINPANPTDNAYQTAHFVTNTPGPYYQSRIDWNGDGWNLVRTDGVLLVFPAFSPVASIQDRFGNKITLTYSDGVTGNIVQVTSSNGRFIRFSYDSSDRVIQATDNIGRTVNYVYDSNGRLSTVTDPNGGVTTYAWDSSNRMQSITDARGIINITNTYDSNDRLTQQVLADSSSYQFAYMLDSNGNVTETDVTDPRGYIRKVTFNSAGYILTDKRAFGTPEESDYSYTLDPASNQVTSVTDPLGRVTNRTYDSNGSLLTVTRLAGTSNAVTQTFTYESRFNQLTSYADTLGHTVRFQLDPNLAQVSGVVDPLGNTTNVSFNAQGRLVSLTDPLSNTTQFGYGADGDLVSITDPLSRTTSFSTDVIGRPATATDPLGGVSKNVYDPINGVLQSINANGASIRSSYTLIGSVSSVTDARGGRISFTYDNRNLPVTRTDAVNATEQVTLRDGMGNVLSAFDRKFQTVSLTYDPLNRPLTATYADGSSVSLTWDLGGRLTQIQDSVGGTITRSYDGLDRQISETTPQGTVNYTYDAAGRRLTMQAGSQAQVSYTYDNANNLTGIAQGSVSVTFGYDASGRRTSATLPGGISAAYTWDAASQLTGISYSSGSTTLGNQTC